MAEIKRSYETVAIFIMKDGEEAVAALIEKFKALISENGTIDNEADWGKRKLAYPIEDETEGYYYVINFTSVPEFPAELDRVYKITDGVLRSLIVENEQ